MSVHISQVGPVVTITIDRPKARNAVDPPTAAALFEAFRAAEANDEILAMVLTGANGHFCAGADLKAVSGGARFEHEKAPWARRACSRIARRKRRACRCRNR